MQRGFSFILIHIYVSLIPKKHDTDHQYSFNSELYPGDFSLKGIKRR